MKRVSRIGSFIFGTVVFITTQGFTVKYYNEWVQQGDWSSVSSFSNAVSFNCNTSGSERSQAQTKISQAAAMGFTVIAGANAPLDLGGIDGAITNFYDTVGGNPAVKFAYFYDEPNLHGVQAGMTQQQISDVVRTYCDRYKLEGERRGINIPGFISYDGAGEARALGGVPDSLAIPGMFSYFAPTIADANPVQFAKYEAKVRSDIKDLKAMAGTRPIMLIGQSFDEGTGMPSAGQQQWYVDDVRNDPQILVFMWFNYDETKKYSDLINAHSGFGRDLINVGVHNVSVSTNVAGTSATIKWQTNLACESGTVEYGATASYGSTVQDAAPGSPNDHSATITNLTPGNVIYYKITSRKTGYTEGPYSSWFGVGAGSLTGTIKDENAKPLSTAKITVIPGNYYAINTSTGAYTINNIPPGNYKVTVQYQANRIYNTTSITHSSNTVLDFTITLIPEFRNGDFEIGDLSGWTATEGFGTGDIRSDGNFSMPSHSGKYFLGKIASRGNGNGKAFQQFRTTTGYYIIASAYVFNDAWTGSPDAGFPNDNYGRIGLDPKAGTDPYSQNIVWSENGKSFQQWGMVSVSTRAESNVMTVFIELYQTQNHDWNKTGIDDIVIRQSVTLVMDTTPPDSPVLLSPDNNTSFSTLPIYFDWSDVSDVNNQSPPVKYDFQIANDINFTALLVLQPTNILGSSHTVTSLNKGTYYWRVRARDSATTPNYSGWTDPPQSFIVNVSINDTTAPSVPILITPVSGSTVSTGKPNFDWADVTDDSPPVFYDIQVDNESAFTLPEINVTNLIQSEYTPTTSLSGGTYYWRVKASDNASPPNYSYWSTTASFTVPDTFPPDIPTPTYPVNETINSLPVNFTWTSVTDVNNQSPPVKYELQVDNDINFSLPLLISTSDLYVSSYTVYSLANGTYYWRVRARDSASTPNYSNWSATVFNFANSSGTITGKVTKSDSLTGLTGCVIEVFNVQIPMSISSTTTNANGDYLITIATGTYDIRVSYPNYQLQTKTGITVTSGETTTLNFTMDLKPYLYVNPTLLEFGAVKQGESKIMMFTVSNSSGGTLSGTIGTDKEWIKISPTSFNTNAQVVNVTVDNSILNQKEGEYTGTITVTSNGGTATVLVKLKATCVLVYPNPYSLSSGKVLTFWGTGVVSYQTKIKIYTLGMDLVKTLTEEKGADTIGWDGTNESGDRIVPGIYFYTTESPTERNAGRFTVIK